MTASRWSCPACSRRWRRCSRGVAARGVPMPGSAAAGGTARDKLVHDLSTPLGGVVGFSEMLIEEAAGEGGPSDDQADLEALRGIAEAGRATVALLEQQLGLDSMGAAWPADGSRDRAAQLG